MRAEPLVRYLPTNATKPVTVATALITVRSRVRRQLDPNNKHATPMLVRLDVHVEPSRTHAEQGVWLAPDAVALTIDPGQACDQAFVYGYLHLSDIFGNDVSVSGQQEVGFVTWDPRRKMLQACGFLHTQGMHGYSKCPRAHAEGCSLNQTVWRALVRSMLHQYKRKGYLHKLMLKHMDDLLRNTDYELANS